MTMALKYKFKTKDEIPAEHLPHFLRRSSCHTVAGSRPITRRKTRLQGAVPSFKWTEMMENQGKLAGRKIHSLYCTFTALIRKSLIISGAGEGNRTLVTVG